MFESLVAHVLAATGSTLQFGNALVRVKNRDEVQIVAPCFWTAESTTRPLRSSRRCGEKTHGHRRDAKCAEKLLTDGSESGLSYI
jgi:hypothetical protein